MMNAMSYKGFLGSIEASLEDNILHGKLLHINGLVTYEAENLSDLKSAFENAVEDYLALCKEQDIEPYKSFTGRFNIRISEEQHRQMALLATQQGKTLNMLMGESVDFYLRHLALHH